VLLGSVPAAFPINSGIALAIGLALVFIYFTTCQVLSAKTLGKSLLGLMVVRVDGGVVSRGSVGCVRIVTRNVLRAVDFLPALYVVGVVAVGSIANAQRIGDLAARTIVARADGAGPRHGDQPPS
jgi:uncharacterized RDD family membrane protein YckC